MLKYMNKRPTLNKIKNELRKTDIDEMETTFVCLDKTSITRL